MKKMAAVLITIAVLSVTTTVRAEPSTLNTQAGYNIGVSSSYYQYREPGLMSLKGGKIGFDLHATKVFQSNLFIRGDLRYAFGLVDYNSKDTGSAIGEPDWYIEVRSLFGKDWVMNENAVLSPYIGLGYRYLFNDGRGITSNGYGGYRRESNYLYVPVGLIYRSALNDQARLVSTLEYDHLRAGKQISHESDVAAGYSDVTNHQDNGYGLKLSSMYQKNSWAIGPFAHYWSIAQSNIVPVIIKGVRWGLVEPKNNTVEFGVKASYQF